MSDDIYTHDPRVHIYISNLREIMIVPYYDEYGLSEAARIYDYPINAEAVGGYVVDILSNLLNNTLERQDEKKNYWLMPKGIKSWNKFQDCSMLVTVCIDREFYFLNRHYSIPCRGFYSESMEPDLTLLRSISKEKLGEAILTQFEHIKMYPYVPKKFV